MAVEVKNVKYKGEFNDVLYDNPAYNSNSSSNNNLHSNSPTTASPSPGSHNTPYNYPHAKSNDVAVVLEPVDGDAHSKGKWSPQGDLEPEEGNKFNQCMISMHDGMSACWNGHKKLWIALILLFFFLLYMAYFGWAMHVEKLQNEDSVRLCWITILVVVCIILNFIWDKIGEKVKKAAKPCTDKLEERGEMISWFVVSILFLFIIIFVLVDILAVTKRPNNLISAVGIIVYILLFFIFSYSPAHVKWRPVVWGLCLQFLFAMIILRWDAGFAAFNWLGERVSEFLSYSDVGAEFLFGGNFRDHFFAFSVLPTVVFFSTAISVLFYLGIMMAVIRKVSWVMEALMGTTAGESLNAAGNIFVGQTEAPLMIRPLLPHMTRSEIHAVMTGGFATIAGGVLAAYILMGAPANHLISASVMSAPAALAMSKLFYPETEKSKTTTKDVASMIVSKEHNVVEAASAGASASVKLVGNIAANLIAFIAILAFINATLTWFGARAGLEQDLTFEYICSWVLWPFAFIMGIPQADCFHVATWIGIKTFLNEFIAYDNFGKTIADTNVWKGHVASNGTWAYGPVGRQVTLFNYTDPNVVNATATPELLLMYGIISERTIAITTYALCGFSNIGSIGVQLGGLGAMAPERKGDLARVAFRAMLCGNVACFMTACIAGLFYNEEV